MQFVESESFFEFGYLSYRRTPVILPLYSANSLMDVVNTTHHIKAINGLQTQPK